MRVILKIADKLSEKELLNLNSILKSENIDGIEISYLGGAYGPIWKKEINYDLSFIKKLSNLNGLSLFLPQTKQLDFLPKTLSWLNIGEFDSSQVSLKPISELSKLTSLSIARNTKDIAMLSKLKQLEHVSLTGYNLKQGEFLCKTDELKSLYLGFGSGEDISFLKNLKNLQRLELLRIKKLWDISSISKLTELKWLKIEDQAQIKELPNFSNLQKLTHLSLINLKNLSNINSLENSHIKELVILNSNLTIEQLKPLVKSKIERICVNLKKNTETQQIKQILGNRIVEYIVTESEKQKEFKYYNQER